MNESLLKAGFLLIFSLGFVLINISPKETVMKLARLYGSKKKRDSAK